MSSASLASESDFKPEELKELRGHFNRFDSDGNGSITSTELEVVLSDLGERLSADKTKELIASIDVDGNGTVEWLEFLTMIKQIRSGKSVSSFGAVYKRAAKAIQIKGEGSASHSFTEEEKVAFVDHINTVLRGDAHLKRLPLDPQSMDIFEAIKDGVLLCKLINKSVPGTIDERVINVKEKKNAWEVSENHTLALNSAKGIGCNIVNIGPTDLTEGRVHLVLGLLWQIIKIGLLSSVSLTNHPELVRMLRSGEELSDLLKLTPEALLLRWFNYHLAEARHPKQVANFSSDIKDSEAYTVLLHQICPNKECDLAPLTQSDLTKRAEMMLERADRIGCKKFVSASDVTKGNAKLNLAFVANLFNTYPALTPMDKAELSSLAPEFAELLSFDQEGTREERAFRFWIQSLGLDCANLFEDMKNGVLLLKTIDAVAKNVDWKRVNATPTNKFKRVENCNYAVELCKSMRFSVVNVGGTDIVDGNKKLILGIVWQLMRMSILNLLKGLSKGGKEMTEAEIIAWANGTVAGAGKSSSITSFKDGSLATGVFLIDLCHAISPRSVNYELVTPGSTDEEREANAKYAISVARKIGCTLFLLWEDIVEVKPKMILTFVGSLASVGRS